MFTIGEVAQRVGVRSSTVRYYERRGILPPAVRRKNGYRSYTDKSIKLLLFTTRARSLGITLKEIKFLLNLILAGQKP
jgi:DNA-binding transcriptional MerR regulator